MKLKQYDPFVIDFKSPWASRCAALLGVSLFIRVVYFFGLMNLTECSAGAVIFDMILAMGLSVGFLVLFSAMRRNVPGIYAIMAAGFCLLLMISTFPSGNALRIILAILGYILAGGVIVMTIGGYLPGKLLSSVLFVLVAVVRLLAFDLGKISLFTWVIEWSWLLIRISLFCLTLSLRPIKENK